MKKEEEDFSFANFFHTKIHLKNQDPEVQHI